MIAHSSLTSSVTFNVSKQNKKKKDKIDMVVVDEKLIRYLN